MKKSVRNSSSKAAKKYYSDKDSDKGNDSDSDDEVLAKRVKSPRTRKQPGPKSKRTSKRHETKAAAEPTPSRKSTRNAAHSSKSDSNNSLNKHQQSSSSDSESEPEPVVEKPKPKSAKKRASTDANGSPSKEKKPKAGRPIKKKKSEEDRYEVEAILDHKIEDDVKYFLVRWKGYDSDVDSWEPRFALAGSKALMAKYLEEHPEAAVSLKKNKRKKKKLVIPHVRPLKIDEEPDYDSEDFDENADWEVEKIIDVQYHRDNTRDFLIRWKGYSSKSDSWEPEKNLDCKDLIEKFTAKLEKIKNVTHKELRQVRAPTQRFTLMTQGNDRRLSKRHVGRQRAVYYDCDE